MKQLLLLSTALFISAYSNAQNRTQQQCADIARSFLVSTTHAPKQIKGIKAVAADDVKLICTSTSLESSCDGALCSGESVSRTPSFYVYAHSNGTPGFVIVSAKEGAQQILGFSYSDYFRADNLNPASRSILNSYSRISAASSTRSDARLAASDIPSDVEPLLGDIQFGQGYPFNGYCPVWDDALVCVTGCEATSMSQIMAYYRYPDRMNASAPDISYSTDRFPSLVWSPSNTVFDWSNIIGTYKSYAAEDTTVIAVNQDPTLSISSITPYIHHQDYLSLDTLVNDTRKDFTGCIRLLVADSTGTFVAYAGTEYDIELHGAEYIEYYTQLALPVNLPSALADGSYRIYLGAKSSDGDSWSLVDCQGLPYYIEAEKSGSVFTALDHSYSCSYNQLQAQAVAKLVSACAYSVEANFGPTSTSAYDTKMISAYHNYFDYSDQMYFINNHDVSSDRWHQLLQQSLIDEHPIQVAGRSGFLGHAFIIDGFQHLEGTPYYHVNWGWEGNNNGYFLIDNLVPEEPEAGGASVNYADSLTAHFNIKPQDIELRSHLFVASNIGLDTTVVEAGKAINLDILHLRNSSATTAPSPDFYLFLIDSEGNEYNMGEAFQMAQDIPTGQYYLEVTASALITNLPADGEYTLDLRCKDANVDDYRSVITPSPVTITVTGTAAAIASPSSSDDAIDAPAYDLQGRRLTSTSDSRIYIQGATKHLTR